MTQNDIEMALEIARTIVRKATPEQILAILNDPNSKLNNGRLKLNEWAGKSEQQNLPPIEMRRAELLATLDIAEPLLAQFSDDV